MKTIVWFRSDLRVYDNPALKNAFLESDEIHAVFIYSKAQLEKHNESNVKIDFLIRNLNSLEQSLATLNIPLILLNSEGFEDNGVLLNQYAIENSINAVYWNNQFGEDEEIRDKKVSKILEESNIRIKNFDDQVIYKPGTLKTGQHQPYSVFTPFKRKWIENFEMDFLDIDFNYNKKKLSRRKSSNIKNFDFHLSQIWRSNTINLGCNRHFEIFDKFKVIPEYCFGCFKVQIELKSIIDLIKLYFVFDKLNLSKNNSRKCMIELRENATGTYKGLIYCSGIDEANLIYEQLSRILDEKIKREIKVGVKRGCTEYGIEYPDYKIIDKDSKDFMIYNNDWKEKEDIIDSNTIKYAREKSINRKPTISGVTLNDILIMKNWIYYAKKIGDVDYKQLDENIFASSHIENQTSKKLKYVKKGISYNLS